MNDIQLGKTTFDKAIKDGQISVKGDQKVLNEFSTMLVDYKFWFNIVTP